MSRVTRRRFLEDSMLATAAAAMAAGAEPAAAQQPRRRSASDTIRLGVIGCRIRGRVHGREFGGLRQLIVWSPKGVSSLDPRNGEQLWHVEWHSNAGLSVATPRKIGNRLFVTTFYNGPLMIEVGPDGKSAEIAWKGSSDSEIKTDGLHSIMPTPWVTDDVIFGVCSYGQLRGLDTKTGERLWETFEATGNDRWWNA